jgi:ketosteroid isomerase-like protein
MSHQGSRSARARSLTLVTALLAALGVLSLFVARADAVVLSGSANPLPGSKFEGGDANQVATLGNFDWANAPFVNHAPDPNANDNIFAGGSEGKENNPGNWNFATQDGGSTPGKNNILDAYSELEPNTNDVFLHLAFTRGDPTGTTYMAFELNQRADLWNNGKVNIPCRTTGDIIVSYQVSGNTPDVILQKWTTTSSDAASGCAKTGSLTDYTAVVDNVNAQGAVNASPVDNFLGSSYPWGSQIPSKLFGESSLNLTSLLSGALGTPCFSFGSIWMHTRASTSDSSNLDDYIAPRPLLVRNCSASGTKFHDLDGDGAKDAGEPGLAGFRVWADYDNDGIRDAGEPFADTDASGNYTITNIQDPSGTYSLREQLTAGSGTGGWTCSYPGTTGTGGDFPCAYTGINGATTPNVSGKDFGNHKPAVVKVEKQTVPDGAPGTFAFTSTIPGKPSFDLSDDGVESATVAPGTYTATETGHPDYDLTGISCTGDADSSGAGQTATFRAQSGETITCTFTNTRKTGQLTVRKVLDPSTDSGRFDLKIGDEVVVDDGGNLAQGTRTLPTGTDYEIGEVGANTSLAKYDSSVECRDGDAIVASGTGASLTDVPVIDGRNVICTFTNARRPGTIKVVKDLVPNDDQGTFDLKVGDDVVAAGVGDGGQGSKTVAPGAYDVSEVGADLAKYDASIACDNGQSGSSSTLAGVEVDSNEVVTCTITNARRPGKLTVVKDLAPADDEGRFDLRIGNDVVKAAAGDGDGGSKSVAPGDYTVSELGANGTSLAKYDASIACDNGQAGPGSSLGGVHVDSNDDVTCTITNERRPGVLKVVKDLKPAGDPGRFDLRIGDDVVKAAAGDGDAGSKTLAPGDYTVSELGADLAKYDASIACDNGQSGSGSSLAGVAVDSDEVVTCTITNERRAGSITVIKDLKPADDDGTFDLMVGDDVVKAGAGDGQQGTKAVATGTFAVSEAGAGGTSLADYDSSIACLKNGQGYKSGAGTSIGGLEVDSDDAIVCTITNIRLGSVTVTKTEGGQAPSGTWKFRLTGGPDDVDLTKDTGADGNPLSFGHLKPGDYTLCEIDLPAGWHSSLGADACVELTIEPGEAESFAVDNTRPSTLVIKEGNAWVHHGETITYTFDVSNTGNTPLKDVSVEDERCDTDPVRDPAHDQNDDGDALLEVGEVWRFTCTMVVPEEHSAEEENPIHNVATAHASDQAGNQVTAQDDHDTTILHPAIAVQKTGADFAYAGDTVTYTFAVTNPGDTALHGVTVSDDRCAPVTGPTAKSGGDADDELEAGETWTFTCVKQIPAGHKIGDENPIRNVATASGTDKGDKTVTSTDDHQVRVLHPAIDIEKTGPATAAVGAPLGYTLTVTNPGDVPFAAQDVGVTDPRCEQPPAGPSTGADTTPGQFDPGDTWTYTCTAQTTGQPAGTFVNTATATGRDFNGRTVSDTDDFPTVLTEAQQVLPEEIVSGTARLSGPSGCVRKAFNATVRGRRIASVTFYVDGHRVKRIVAKQGQRVFRAKVVPGSAIGVHRVTARVVFKAASQTKARTLRLSYQRCKRQVITPQFTG